MSEVKIEFKKRESRKMYGQYNGVPILYREYNSLYMLIRDVSAVNKPYRVISVYNGHVQIGSVYDSVEDFIKDHTNKNIEFVDVEITTKPIE